jgi:hypothetical protein
MGTYRGHLTFQRLSLSTFVIEAKRKLTIKLFQKSLRSDSDGYRWLLSVWESGESRLTSVWLVIDLH